MVCVKELSISSHKHTPCVHTLCTVVALKPTVLIEYSILDLYFATMASNLNRRSYLASMEDLSDIETDISNERVVHVNSFGKFYEHFLFILKYSNM